MSKNIFETSDMTMVTYLRMCGRDPLHIALRYGKSVRWIFELDPELEQNIVTFESGEARVDPMEFSRLYKMAINELHDTKNTAQEVSRR